MPLWYNRLPSPYPLSPQTVSPLHVLRLVLPCQIMSVLFLLAPLPHCLSACPFLGITENNLPACCFLDFQTGYSCPACPFLVLSFQTKASGGKERLPLKSWKRDRNGQCHMANMTPAHWKQTPSRDSNHTQTKVIFFAVIWSFSLIMQVPEKYVSTKTV